MLVSRNQLSFFISYSEAAPRAVELGLRQPADPIGEITWTSEHSSFAMLSKGLWV